MPTYESQTMGSVQFESEILVEQLLQENDILYDKISKSLKCSRQEVPAALGEVLRFLFLVSRQKSGKLTPSQNVDLVWHEFILCTRAYEKFCKAHFDKFIHHHPGGSSEENRRQFEETLRQYSQDFGRPNHKYWGTETAEVSTCGACEAT